MATAGAAHTARLARLATHLRPAAAAPFEPVAEQPLALAKQPWLQWPASGGIFVLCETTAPCEAELELFAAARQLVRPTGSGFEGEAHGAHLSSEQGVRRLAPEATLDSGPGVVHRFAIDGLEPNTSYNYRITCSAGGATVSSELCPFRTAPLPGDEGGAFSFTVCAEFGGSGVDDWNEELFGVMADIRPDFILFPGDVVSDGGRAEDWDRFFFGPVSRQTPWVCGAAWGWAWGGARWGGVVGDLLAPFLVLHTVSGVQFELLTVTCCGAQGQELLARTPFFLAPGNHEELHHTGGDTGLWEGGGAPFFNRFIHQPPHGSFCAFQWCAACPHRHSPHTIPRPFARA